MILTFSRNAKLDFVRKGTGRVFKKKKCFHDMNVRTIHSFALYIMNNILGTRVTSKNESVNLYVLIATTLLRTTLRGTPVVVTNEELKGGVTCEEFVAKLRRCYTCMARSCEFSAYNGVAFDHRILARYFPDFKLFHCTDALATIRAHYLSTRDIWSDRKLANVHRLICGDTTNYHHYTAHRAKADVLMLRDIYLELRI